jgi:heme/copper-type cytochrome/quinol oxidase subunit 2
MSYSPSALQGGIEGSQIMRTVRAYGNSVDVMMMLVCIMLIITGILGMQIYSKAKTWKETDGDGGKKKSENATTLNEVFQWFQVIGIFGFAIFMSRIGYDMGKKSGLKSSPSGNLAPNKGDRGASITGHVFAFVMTGVMLAMSSMGVQMYNDVATWEEIDKDKSDNEKSAKAIYDTFISFIVITSVFFVVYVGYIGYSSDAGKKLLQQMGTPSTSQVRGGRNNNWRKHAPLSEFFQY